MTNEYVKYFFNMLKIHILARKEERNPLCKECCGYFKRNIEDAFDFMDKAIDKQIAERPKKKACATYTLFVCPNCGHVIEAFSYCPICGQAIDWSKEGE